MQFENQKYIYDRVSGEKSGIQATVNGCDMSIPIAKGNRHYDELMRQVAEEGLVITEEVS